MKAIVFVLSLSLPAQVPYERIVTASSEPSNWLTYSGNYPSYRFSALNQINSKNVSALKPTWVYQLDEKGEFETSPIVVRRHHVHHRSAERRRAIDLRTGRPLWTYRKRTAQRIKTLGFGRVNRGVAILDDAVYCRHAR